MKIFVDRVLRDNIPDTMELDNAIQTKLVGINLVDDGNNKLAIEPVYHSLLTIENHGDTLVLIAGKHHPSWMLFIMKWFPFVRLVKIPDDVLEELEDV